ncbi:MAG: hypothetical protein PVF89_02020 [Lysobacterales bacterium]|jgi:hypothetical protein
MKTAQIQPPAPRVVHAQAIRVVPGHGTGILGAARNDARYRNVFAAAKAVLCLLANVVGGSLVILGMFALPLVIAGLL